MLRIVWRTCGTPSCEWYSTSECHAPWYPMFSGFRLPNLWPVLFGVKLYLLQRGLIQLPLPRTLTHSVHPCLTVFLFTVRIGDVRFRNRSVDVHKWWMGYYHFGAKIICSPYYLWHLFVPHVSTIWPSCREAHYFECPRHCFEPIRGPSQLFFLSFCHQVTIVSFRQKPFSLNLWKGITTSVFR